MGFLCGKTCECKRRCKSWFSSQPDTERACKNACKDNSGLTREEYLCSGNYADQAAYILQYGFDPCPGDGINFENTVVDPGGTQADQRAEQWQRMAPVLLVLLVFVGWALSVYLKRK